LSQKTAAFSATGFHFYGLLLNKLKERRYIFDTKYPEVEKYGHIALVGLRYNYKGKEIKHADSWKDRKKASGNHNGQMNL
jgi:hypothetical protein